MSGAVTPGRRHPLEPMARDSGFERSDVAEFALRAMCGRRRDSQEIGKFLTVN